jgi:hypothetical protein
MKGKTMRKVIALIMASSMTLTVSLTVSASASSTTPKASAAWSQWYVHFKAWTFTAAAISGTATTALENNNSSAYIAALIAEGQTDIGLAALADSPSRLVNTDVILAAKWDNRSNFYYVICALEPNSKAALKSADAADNVFDNYMLLIGKEIVKVGLP